MDYNEIEYLVELAKANDKKAKEELMMKFTPLILNLSKKCFVDSYEFADVKNECYHTLFKCVRVYNLEKHRFVAYATNAIKNCINLLIRVSIRRHTTEGHEAFILDEKLEHTLYSDLEDPSNFLLSKINKTNLKLAFDTLNFNEQELINYVFFQKYSLNKYAIHKGIPYQIVIAMKNDILYKLKKSLNTQLHNDNNNNNNDKNN